MSINGCKVSLAGDEIVVKSEVKTAQLCEYTKTPLNCTFYIFILYWSIVD